MHASIRASTRRLALAALTAILASLAPRAAAADEPLAPPFGNNQIAGAIESLGDGPDRDSFVAPLLPGERLAVAVDAPRDSALRPALRLIDPSGADRTPALKSHRGGATVSFQRFEVDMPGPWTVVVEGADGTEGPYRAQFRIAGAPAPEPVVLLAGGGPFPLAAMEFEAVQGARLELRARPLVPGARLTLAALTDPSGDPVPAAAGSVEPDGGGFRFRDLPLSSGAGGYRLVVAAERPHEVVRLSWRVTPPKRPRGFHEFAAVEPLLSAREEPVVAAAGTVARVHGRGFSPWPLPRVYAKGLRAEVRTVDAAGTWIDFVVPDLAVDTLAPVLVVNPDGQATRRPDLLLVPRPLPPSVAAIDPSTLSLGKGETVWLKVRLSGFATTGGVVVSLATSGGIGTVPATVLVPELGTEASFPFTATTDVPAEGRITATAGGSAACEVEVRWDPPPPPQEIDLSGWTLVQANTSRTFTLPSGTVLAEGGTLVVARNASRSAFESFWGVTMDASARYVDAADTFPVINGDETFTLKDAQGVVVDGATIGLVAGRGYRRIAGKAAGAAASWEVYESVAGNAAPGAGPGGDASGNGVYISEFSDASGTGNFVYEFVEIHFDGNP